jgi:hypothetical protein
MNATSKDIADMLEADSSLGLVFASNLFIGKEPATPKDTVTIFDTPGFPPQLTLDGKGGNYEYPSIQIRIRNKHYIDGMALTQKIKDSLHGRAKETWGGSLYSVIYCSSGPALLDWDDSSNARFIVNFNIQRRF